MQAALNRTIYSAKNAILVQTLATFLTGHFQHWAVYWEGGHQVVLWSSHPVLYTNTGCCLQYSTCSFLSAFFHHQNNTMSDPCLLDISYWIWLFSSSKEASSWIIPTSINREYHMCLWGGYCIVMLLTTLKMMFLPRLNYSSQQHHHLISLVSRSLQSVNIYILD